MSLKPYPKYKDSGVEWLGEVPEHWEIRRIDSVVDTEKDIVLAEDLNGREIFHYSIPAVQSLGDGQIEDGTDVDSSKFIIHEPQVLISKLNPRKATVCVARPQTALTVCSTEFVSIIPRQTDLAFTYYTLLSEPFRQRLEALVESATKSHQRVSPADILKARWAWPTQSEQLEVVSFLERETAKIDTLIAEQEKLIELLAEKRQATISHAVTKGLNPNVKMKESGVEWLGEMPEHWEVRSISSISTKITNGYVGPTRDILKDGGVRYLQSLHIKNNRIVFDTPYYVDPVWSDDHKKSILQEGDVLVVQTGDIGQVAVVPKEFEGCNCHALIIITPLHSAVLGSWLAQCLNSEYGYHSLLSIQTGALHPHLNCGNVKFLAIPVPPLAEQSDILMFVGQKLTQFDALTAEANRLIDLLRERRTALISAAVTGKIDVRGVIEPEKVAA